MKYKCVLLQDNKKNDILETVSAVGIGLLGGMCDREADCFELIIDDENDSLEIVASGLSAWGGVHEIKESQNEKHKLSEIKYEITDDIITLQIKKNTIKYKII